MLLQGHTPTMKFAPPHYDVAAVFGRIAIFWLLVAFVTGIALWFVTKYKPQSLEIEEEEEEEPAVT